MQLQLGGMLHLPRYIPIRKAATVKSSFSRASHALRANSSVRQINASRTVRSWNGALERTPSAAISILSGRLRSNRRQAVVLQLNLPPMASVRCSSGIDRLQPAPDCKDVLSLSFGEDHAVRSRADIGTHEIYLSVINAPDELSAERYDIPIHLPR
jgi:hypothetical protein